MKFTTEKDRTPLRTRAGFCGPALKSVLFYLLNVYSAPSPAGRDVLTLLSLCFTLAIITGGLLHHWLAKTLIYDQEASIPMACIYSVSIFLLSFLCHPLRCVLTMILPTICTKQGRKLLNSASVMILVLNVVPNITANIGAVARILKCSGEGFAKTLLNTSKSLNEAKKNLVENTFETKGETLQIVEKLRKLDHCTHVNVSAVKARFTEMIGRMDVEFMQANNLLKDCKLLSNRIIAGLFVALLILEAAGYLKSYLTSVQFDNGHISKEMQEKPNHEGNRRNKMCLRRCRISSQEWTSSVIALVLVTLYFFAIALIVALDHVVYQVVQMIALGLQDLPPTSVSLNVKYKVKYVLPGLYIFSQLFAPVELMDFQRDYKTTFRPSLCNATTSAPSQGVAVLLGCLWLISYSLVFLEVYARRLRRNIAASFFREQEERRRVYLAEKIQGKPNKREQIKTIHAEILVVGHQ